MINVHEAAQRLIKVVTGEVYGDGELVKDIGIGTENSSDEVWVSGNWNGELGGRLFKALERIGIEGEWLDEVDRCIDCGKMIRTQPSYYGWQGRYLITEEGDRICFDCLDTSNDEILEEFNYIDNAEKAIPDILGKHLETWGWAPYNGVFESGWHPGQTDNPRTIFDKIKEKEPNLSVVFRLDETSQFYIRFTAWTKDRGTEDEDE